MTRAEFDAECCLTLEELRDKYDEKSRIGWGEHPLFPMSDWRYEVANGDTRVGYWEWVNCRFDLYGNDEEFLRKLEK